MDVGLGTLLIRLALGLMLLAHGWNKVFGPGGLDGTQRWFEGLGLRPAMLHAEVAAATELVAGALMMVGFLTGVVAAAFVGLMAVASFTNHRGKGFFVFKGGWEYTVLVAIIAIAIASIGPGSISVDGALGLDLAGTTWAVVATLLGCAGAGGLLAVSYRPNPA